MTHNHSSVSCTFQRHHFSLNIRRNLCSLIHKWPLWYGSFNESFKKTWSNIFLMYTVTYQIIGKLRITKMNILPWHPNTGCIDRSRVLHWLDWSSLPKVALRLHKVKHISTILPCWTRLHPVANSHCCLCHQKSAALYWNERDRLALSLSVAI